MLVTAQCLLSALEICTFAEKQGQSAIRAVLRCINTRPTHTSPIRVANGDAQCSGDAAAGCASADPPAPHQFISALGPTPKNCPKYRGDSGPTLSHAACGAPPRSERAEPVNCKSVPFFWHHGIGSQRCRQRRPAIATCTTGTACQDAKKWKLCSCGVYLCVFLCVRMNGQRRIVCSAVRCSSCA